eukprot:11684547-Karenia_brevis.AAC.1
MQRLGVWSGPGSADIGQGLHTEHDQPQCSDRAAMDMDMPVGMDMQRDHLQCSNVVVRAAMDMDMPDSMDMERDYLQCSNVVVRAAMDLDMPVGMDM